MKFMIIGGVTLNFWSNIMDIYNGLLKSEYPHVLFWSFNSVTAIQKVRFMKKSFKM